MLSFVAKRTYSVTSRKFAEANAASAELVLNLLTPHSPIMKGKVVKMVTFPGELGDYGITAGHSPIISQLKPGIISILHKEVTSF
jgi:F-type H+-transporting ATPase subunit delta